MTDETLPIPPEKLPLAEPVNTGASSVPTEHEQPAPQPAGTPLMTAGLLPANPEAPSEEAMARDHDIRTSVNLAEGVQLDTTNPHEVLDNETRPTEDADGRTLVGVTTLTEAHALPELDIDEAADAFEGEQRFLRAFMAEDGRTMRVVYQDKSLAAQEIKV